MQRIQEIIKHPLFLMHMEKNAESEKDRQFCRHDLSHALDVARISQLRNVEEGLLLEKELLYAAALLHDITKWQQYADKSPHNETAIAPATKILQETGFTKEEIDNICYAIYHHRKGTGEDNLYARLLFWADKRARACFFCEMGETCHRAQDLKNFTLEY